MPALCRCMCGMLPAYMFALISLWLPTFLVCQVAFELHLETTKNKPHLSQTIWFCKNKKTIATSDCLTYTTIPLAEPSVIKGHSWLKRPLLFHRQTFPKKTTMGIWYTVTVYMVREITERDFCTWWPRGQSESLHWYPVIVHLSHTTQKWYSRLKYTFWLCWASVPLRCSPCSMLNIFELGMLSLT